MAKTTDKKEEVKNNTKDVKREFMLNKDVSAESVQPIIEGINAVNNHDKEQEERNPDYVRKPIKLIVDSLGGYIYDGFTLANTIDTSETPVHTYCLGKAMSMGFLLFVVGHKRFVAESATLLYHDGGTTLAGTFETIKQDLERNIRLRERGNDFIVRYTNIPRSRLEEVVLMKQDWDITGAEALKLGVADEIIPSTRAKHRKNLNK
ncbi:ClpP family protease [Bacillus stercoris]|uniref:ClpP family protease n=1 Tax=Bacillus stercoris TaxID=2054641 RepID=UPI003CF97ECF